MMVAVAGVTVTLASLAVLTLSVAVPVLPPYVAEIVVTPADTGTPRPVAAPTVATAGAEDVHAALVVTSAFVPSAKSAVAVKATLAPPT